LFPLAAVTKPVAAGDDLTAQLERLEKRMAKLEALLEKLTSSKSR
jgi:acyl dehydratase